MDCAAFSMFWQYNNLLFKKFMLRIDLFSLESMFGPGNELTDKYRNDTNGFNLIYS